MASTDLSPRELAKKPFLWIVAAVAVLAAYQQLSGSIKPNVDLASAHAQCDDALQHYNVIKAGGRLPNSDSDASYRIRLAQCVADGYLQKEAINQF